MPSPRTPPSNALYPVLDRTRLREDYGRVPDFTLKLIRRASEIAAAEGEEQKLQGIAREVARLAPAFHGELVRELLAINPWIAPDLIGNEHLGEEGARAVEVYARRVLLEVPLTAIAAGPDGAERAADVFCLREAAETLRCLPEAGHRWQESTREQLLEATREGEGMDWPDGHEPAARRAQFAAHALLARNAGMPPGELAGVYERTHRLLDLTQIADLATHPEVSTELRLRVLEDYPRVAAAAICEDDELRSLPALRAKLTGVRDLGVLAALLRDDVREEMTDIFHTIMEMDAEKGLEMLEQPRYRALSRHHLSAEALMPALTSDRGWVRRKAILLAGRLADDQREVGREEIAREVEEAIETEGLF